MSWQPHCAGGYKNPLRLRTVNPHVHIRLDTRVISANQHTALEGSMETSVAWKVVGIGGAALAGIAAKKGLNYAWEKATNKPVPLDPANDEEVTLSEAIIWTIASGVGVAVAKLVVQRLTVKKLRGRFGDAALPKPMRSDAAN